jgi:flagellar biosynthesis/type III secretory pathway protein FliH
METPQNAETKEVTVETFRPGGFEPATWAVVESRFVSEVFKTTNFEQQTEVTHVVDPMFANFDGIASTQESSTGEGEDAFLEPEESFPATDLESDSADPEAIQDGQDYATSAEQEEEHEVVDPLHEQGFAESMPAEAMELETERPADPEMDADGAEALASSEDELAALKEQAYAEGLAAGRSELSDAKAQIEARYEELFADAQAQFTEALRNAERQAVELSFQVAQKLIGTVLESDRSYIQEVITQALQAAAGSDVIRIRVSPQDFEFLSLNDVAAAIQAKRGGTWKFERDDSIRAGCIVSTNAGEIDFDLDASWGRMRDKVLRGPKS